MTRLTYTELLDAPERTVQVRPPLTEAEREMRRLREALAQCRTQFDLILVATERGLRGDHVASLTELHAIEECARAGKEAANG